MSNRAVDILTYKKVVDFKNLHNAKWVDVQEHFKLNMAEILFIKEHYTGFLEAKRKEEVELINQIKKEEKCLDTQPIA